MTHSRVVSRRTAQKNGAGAAALPGADVALRETIEQRATVMTSAPTEMSTTQ